MANRELCLDKRIEGTREVKEVIVPLHFDLDQIFKHYSETYNTIEDQFLVADDLLPKGNKEACETIWRSQIVLAEGLLDFYFHELSKYCLFQMFAGNWEKLTNTKGLWYLWRRLNLDLG